MPGALPPARPAGRLQMNHRRACMDIDEDRRCCCGTQARAVHDYLNDRVVRVSRNRVAVLY